MAIVIGIIMILPQFFLMFDLGKSYQGISAQTGDQEAHYLARVREIYDGHLRTAGTFLTEYKNGPYLQPPLPEIMIAAIGKIFFMPPNAANDLAKFIFPAVLFLVLYFFMFSFGQNKYIAAFTAASIMLGMNLFNAAFLPLSRISENFLNFNSFSRPVNPPISSLFFFGFLFCFWRALETKRVLYAATSGLILGLSFYVYLYTWSFIFVFMGLLFMFYLIRKDRPALKIILYTGAFSLVAATPYLINLFQAVNHPFYQEAGRRFGMIETRGIITGRLAPLLLAAFLLLFSRKNKNLFYFFLALVLAPFIVLNQQLITGRQMISAHYHWYIVVPLGILILCLVCFNWLEKFKNKNVVKIIAGAGVIVLLLNGLAVSWFSYAKNKNTFLYMQRYGSLVKWMRGDISKYKDRVIFGDNGVTTFAAAYGPMNVYYNNNAANYLVPDAYLEHSLFLDYKLQGLSPGDAEKLFPGEKRKEISSYIHGLYYREKCGDWICIPDEEINKLISGYSDFYNGDLFAQIKKYPLDYIAWDTRSEPNRVYDRIKFLEKIYADDQGFIVYKVNNL